MTSGKRVKAERQAKGYSRSAALKALEAERRRRRIWIGVIASAALACAGIVVGLFVARSGSGPTNPKLTLRPITTLGRLQSAGSPGPAGPEGVPIPPGPALSGTSSLVGGNSVDGIECQTNEQTIFHIHAHLTIFVGATALQVSDGIGIPGAQTQNATGGSFVTSGSCFYWLHTHASDGIIHIESPVQRTYTLGDFFDIWGQPLAADQVGPERGHVTAFYDGKVYIGKVRNIPLEAHAQIQLDVGRPLVSPVSITFPSGL